MPDASLDEAPVSTMFQLLHDLASDGRATEQTIFLTVLGVLCEKFDIAPQNVHLDRDLVRDLGIEPADLDYLALALEEAFEIEIAPADAARIISVGDAVNCVLARGPAASVEPSNGSR